MWKGVYKAKNKLLNTYLLVKQIAVKGYGNRDIDPMQFRRMRIRVFLRILEGGESSCWFPLGLVQ